jgi:hypothetical protein
MCKTALARRIITTYWPVGLTVRAQNCVIQIWPGTRVFDGEVWSGCAYGQNNQPKCKCLCQLKLEMANRVLFRPINRNCGPEIAAFGSKRLREDVSEATEEMQSRLGDSAMGRSVGSTTVIACGTLEAVALGVGVLTAKSPPIVACYGGTSVKRRPAKPKRGVPELLPKPCIGREFADKPTSRNLGKNGQLKGNGRPNEANCGT